MQTGGHSGYRAEVSGLGWVPVRPPDPAARPASAAAMAAALPDIGTRRFGELAPVAGIQKTSPRWWLIGAALVALAGLAMVTASYYLPVTGAGLDEQDTVVLADFENATGDAVFDGTLKVALAVALEQSPFLKVFPDDPAISALNRSRRAILRARPRVIRSSGGRCIRRRVSCASVAACWRAP